MNDSQHEYYEQLCALAPTGQLPPEDFERLNQHLNHCVSCQESLRNYQQVCGDLPGFLTDTEMSLDRFESVVRDPKRKVALRHKLMAKLRTDDEAIAEATPGGFFGTRFAPLAVPAFVAMSVALAIALTWGWNERNAQHLAREESKYWKNLARRSEASASTNASQLHSQVQGAARALETAESRARAIDEKARRQQDQWNAERAALQSKLAVLERQTAMLTNDLEAIRSSSTSLGNKNDRLATDLSDAQKRLRDAQAEIVRLSELHNRDSSSTAILAAQVRQLEETISEQSQTTRREAMLLQTDRDIRDLMGARSLHVVDVFDVDTKGRIRSPFGRVFYTEGKSLVFYAFDLEKQKGVHPTSAFQAWGQSDRGSTASLGILYTDNVNRNRWMLQFDDPKVLSELQAVYVTIEPPGGSKQPSGRKLLVANLTSKPNHP